MPDSNKPVHPADLKKLKTRGKGVRKDYEPFIYIHELSSLGESCRSNSATVGRVHHLLSRLELAAFLSFDYSSNIIDIREQFPIPIEDSLDICRQLGIKHPQISGKLKVVTTDLLFDFKKQKQLALAVKYVDELADPRVIDKLQIEKAHWENKGANWRIFTERQVEPGLKENLQWIHPALVNDSGERSNQELLSIMERLLTHQNVKVGGLCAQLDDSYQVEPGFHIEAFRLAIARKIVLAPLGQSFYHWTTSELAITEHSLALRRGNVS
ncbi:TnsA endonuclease N-terminal domain-containing protein [Vibrio diazotrophicus]|jgi:hypothetical protein|uniref:Heteromeric transposase endonuclease subunit TnsA n=1 Tax=Vibrio diazotrophicus TaxID=685 RepID=A0ABX4W941_VIBDI|nr:TnsA endonuclease N-terminal domain-containing protein [Vibrio diazotrophicus]PNI00028.1 heteromeric transposase endonuclease subunit TnsA [Vibrio diazotrophicus]